MNGRVYDPYIGRFLSPDPFVQMPDYTQSLNRYSYVMNRPMNFTDPSGYFLRGPIDHFWKRNQGYIMGTLQAVTTIAASAVVLGLAVGLAWTAFNTIQAVRSGQPIGQILAGAAIGVAMSAIPSGETFLQVIGIGAGKGVLGSILGAGVTNTDLEWQGVLFAAVSGAVVAGALYLMSHGGGQTKSEPVSDNTVVIEGQVELEGPVAQVEELATRKPDGSIRERYIAGVAPREGPVSVPVNPIEPVLIPEYLDMIVITAKPISWWITIHDLVFPVFYQIQLWSSNPDSQSTRTHNDPSPKTSNRIIHNIEDLFSAHDFIAAQNIGKYLSTWIYYDGVQEFYDFGFERHYPSQYGTRNKWYAIKIDGKLHRARSGNYNANTGYRNLIWWADDEIKLIKNNTSK
jgi:hypothetical protein